METHIPDPVTPLDPGSMLSTGVLTNLGCMISPPLLKKENKKKKKIAEKLNLALVGWTPTEPGASCAPRSRRSAIGPWIPSSSSAARKPSAASEASGAKIARSSGRQVDGCNICHKPGRVSKFSNGPPNNNWFPLGSLASEDPHEGAITYSALIWLLRAFFSSATPLRMDGGRPNMYDDKQPAIRTPRPRISSNPQVSPYCALRFSPASKSLTL